MRWRPPRRALAVHEYHSNTRMAEAGSGEGRTWRVIVVGALLVGGLWGVAVAWTLLALVRAM